MTQEKIDLLIAAHLAWREKLLRFAYSGFNDGWTCRDRAGDPTVCELGKMLAQSNISNLSIWPKIVEAHKEFHREAKVIYDLAEAKKRSEVEFSLNSSTSGFVESTMKLVSLLKELKAYIEAQRSAS